MSLFAFLAAPFIHAFYAGLGWFGLNIIGPLAGSLAAAFQAVFGATWTFSLFQSAAMGGYGAAIVEGVIQGLTGLRLGVAALFWWLGGA